MNALALALEGWFDQRNVRRILKRLRGDPELSESFDLEQTAIYRVRLPDDQRIEVRANTGESWSFHRTFLEIFGLGDRLYLVDSVPLGWFEKPMVLVRMRGLASAPRWWLPVRSHFTINGNQFPHWHFPSLRGSAVFNRAAIPIPSFRAAPRSGVVAALLPLAGPFPPDRRPIPDGNLPFQPTCGGGQPTGTRRLLFYGLCCQNPGAPLRGEARDGLLDAVDRIKGGFEARGYTSRRLVADSSYRTFDSMMQQFKHDIEQDQAYCQSADDQLVICLGAHGHDGTISYQWSPNHASESVDVVRFWRALAAIQKIATAPGKVYLIVYSCHSGQFFDANCPASLGGIHLLTATQDRHNVARFGGLDHWIEDALADPCVLNWETFLDRVMWGWTRSRVHHPRPRSGDLRGCRTQITLRNIAYAGVDLGPEWRFNIQIEGNDTAIPPTTLTHAGDTAVSHLVHDWLYACGPDRIELWITNQSWLVDPSRNVSHLGGGLARFTCDGTHTHSYQHDASASHGQQIAQVTLTFQLTTVCT